MRRLILIVMMLVLPLQYSWAAVAASSLHAAQADASGLMGHHDSHHDHDAASGPAAAPDAGLAGTSVDDHDDGNTCHSHGHSHGGDVAGFAWSLGIPDTGGTLAAHGIRHMPDTVPDELLRPPLARLA